VVSTLQDITGTIALAGAGKMGGAMLTGWLAGGLDATRRATKIWQAALEAYEPPPLEPAIAEALQAFVVRRREELKFVDH